MRRSLCRAAIAAVAGGLLCAAAAAAAPYSFVPAPNRATAQFRATYTGSGTYHTDYHSNPPNPGGNPDTNDAHDSSTQSWSLRYDGSVTLGRCRRHRAQRPKRCLHVEGISSAHGTTSATGQVNHTHIDGLYPADDASASCQLSAQTTRGAKINAALTITSLPSRHRVAITATDPVGDVLGRLPSQCPSTPDGIDGLADSYFIPGFSFAPSYGPQRWFRPRTVTIPAATLDQAKKIEIRLGLTKAGTPPADCAVPNPAYQRCSTGGSWSGTLTLTRKP